MCLALKESALWFLIVRFNCVCSVDHGPLQDNRWFVEAQEAARTYCELSRGAACPLWQELYPKIANDKGLCATGEGDEAADLWRSIPEARTPLLCMTSLQGRPTAPIAMAVWGPCKTPPYQCRPPPPPPPFLSEE